MSGKNIVIFGASGGIGSATARILNENGHGLFLVGRTQEKLSQLASSLTGTVHTFVADATNSDEVAAAFQKAGESLDSLHGVVNCVGSVMLKPAHLTSDEDWRRTMALNLDSSFYILREAVKLMKKGKSGGAIVFCSSAASQIGLSNHEAIAAAKGGIISLVKSAATTYAGSAIRVNAVAPGLVETPMTERITGNPAAKKVSLSMHPLGRLGEPDDIAEAIVYLLSDAAGWISGQVLTVDGGLSTLKTSG